MHHMKKITLTDETSSASIPNPNNYNFLSIHTIQILKGKPIDLIINIKRTDSFGESLTSPIKCSLYRFRFELVTGCHILHTSEIDFFTQMENFGVKNRRININSSSVDNHQFTIEIYYEMINKATLRVGV